MGVGVSVSECMCMCVCVCVLEKSALPRNSTGVDVFIEGVALGEPFFERLSQIDNKVNMQLVGVDGGAGGDGVEMVCGTSFVLRW